MLSTMIIIYLFIIFVGINVSETVGRNPLVSPESSFGESRSLCFSQSIGINY